MWLNGLTKTASEVLTEGTQAGETPGSENVPGTIVLGVVIVVPAWTADGDGDSDGDGDGDGDGMRNESWITVVGGGMTGGS